MDEYPTYGEQSRSRKDTEGGRLLRVQCFPTGTAHVLHIFSAILAALLSVLYLTLYHWLYPHLLAWLRSETVRLTWKDLRLPAILAAASVIIGLIIIT